MKLRAGIVAVWCLVSLCANAMAAPPSTTPSALPKKPAATESTAPRKTTAPAVKTDTGAKGIRTIDAINIEGEIAVPQVLFITSRDNRRYRDGLGKNFRLGTLDVTRSTAMPNRLCVAGKSGSEPIKEE
jgi:hypothetical protein